MSGPEVAGARTRSWWGWGTVEASLTRQEQADLDDRVRTFLPDADLTVHEPPDPTSLPVADPRIALPDPLAHLGSADPVDRLAHAHGQAYRDVVRALRGELVDVPDLVVRPLSEKDVVQALDWCSDAGVAVIPFGGGTSVVGGVEPRGLAGFPGVVSLDLRSLDHVLEVDEVSRAARIQAGVLGPHLEDQLRPHGLTLRHFPQSFEFSTLGGWLATRAGGHYATVRTHIDDLTESVRVVTPRGVSESRRLPGSGAGPSPDALFLGSEGALGVITEAWVRLQSRPRWRGSASLTFTDFAEGVAATRALAHSGLDPANCRLLDPVEATLNAGTGTTVLILGFESADHPVRPSMERALELCRDHGGEVGPGAVLGDVDDAPRRADASEEWRSSFLRMPYQRDAMAQRAMIAETFETACTWADIDALRETVTAAALEAMASAGVIGVVTCRFTHVYPDGPVPYFGVIGAGTWGRTVEQWDAIKGAVSDAVIAAGGTITHHHAVGRDHRPWYDRQRPDTFAAALTAAKSALDPAGVLNPGVLVDPSGPATRDGSAGHP